MELLKHLQELIKIKDRLYIDYYENYTEEEIKENILFLIQKSSPYLSFNVLKYLKDKNHIKKVINKVKKLDLLIAFREQPKYSSRVFLLFQDPITKDYYEFTNDICRNPMMSSPFIYLNKKPEICETILNSVFINSGMYLINMDPIDSMIIKIKIDNYLDTIRS